MRDGCDVRGRDAPVVGDERVMAVAEHEVAVTEPADPPAPLLVALGASRDAEDGADDR